MKHRQATREDLVAWFGSVPAASMRAIVLEDGGNIVGIAGVSLMSDHLQAFSSQKPGTDGRFAKARMAIEFKRLLKSSAGPVFALCSDTEPTAPWMLTHLGFRPITQRQWRYG